MYRNMCNMHSNAYRYFVFQLHCHVECLWSAQNGVHCALHHGTVLSAVCKLASRMHVTLLPLLIALYACQPLRNNNVGVEANLLHIRAARPAVAVPQQR
jgi:hypothetical protein